MTLYRLKQLKKDLDSYEVFVKSERECYSRLKRNDGYGPCNVPMVNNRHDEVSLYMNRLHRLRGEYRAAWEQLKVDLTQERIDNNALYKVANKNRERILSDWYQACEMTIE